ncbi:MAG: rhomboid family intramembrane serine protease [Ferruginibacter sp.]|nr:rhomboid family intramembrane serine protease [Ferruginibacter sp.]
MAFNNYGNRFQQTTPIVLNLIIINVLVYLAQVVTGGNNDPNAATDLFALHHYKSVYFQPYQVVTHMFMHGGFFHLLFNMFALWMFGSMVERVWGPKRFLIFYFICGLAAAFFQMGSYAFDWWQVDHSSLSPDDMDRYQAILRVSATVGASGAIMGVLAAFGYLFPNTELIIFPIPIPVKAKWAILGMIAIDVFGGVVKVQGDNIAHFAHIGGAVTGFLLVLYWNKKNKKTFY